MGLIPCKLWLGRGGKGRWGFGFVCQWQQGGVTSGRLLSQHFSSPTHSWKTLLPPPAVSILALLGRNINASCNTERRAGTMGKVSGEDWRWSGEWWRLWCLLYGHCASTNHPKKSFKLYKCFVFKNCTGHLNPANSVYFHISSCFRLIGKYSNLWELLMF